jgi:transcriptional regulator with XRE-family HTH domain
MATTTTHHNGEWIMSDAHVDPVTIGQRVKKARQQNKLTQVELAQSLDITPIVLSHYECGRRLLPVEVAFKLARIHHVDLNWLYGFRPRRAR